VSTDVFFLSNNGIGKNPVNSKLSVSSKMIFRKLEALFGYLTTTFQDDGVEKKQGTKLDCPRSVQQVQFKRCTGHWASMSASKPAKFCHVQLPQTTFDYT
jgi:hypothetical protein